MTTLSAPEMTAIGAVAGVSEVLIMQVNAASIAPITAIQVSGAAAGAGAASALVGCPAELLMIQQQKSGRPLLAEARRIVFQLGTLGLYRGLTAMTIRESVYTGSYLGLCPVLKGYLDDRDLLQDYPASSSLVLSGITAGLFAAFATQPIDTAKTRQQAFLDSKVHPEYATLRSTLRHLVQTNGVTSLWAGISPRAFRIATAVVILQAMRSKLISVVEGIKDPELTPEEELLLTLPRD
ncbi:mitochondrial carrier [Coccomyxa subellipsoidea C-169]|uniref:Mitochondrial carrier n=1 Tax=Coccomyxa subellipsoidea (strain C-169) TaxID=574566 RepID=I0Z860_COCSC|nr:mitochondrial carrier [Coccomyxa subellipsoidea C-169]EIE26829.1 mitochondrial carrier [Coccomyxa subellipsoidea C-169]|eukprot:XP_005651373.1 mitochondrial carrier [Coccomyxa subellipsoidea C-169]